jgi:predicted acetyltransferase
MTSLKIAAHLEIVPASLDQQPILANLFQLYAHDFSEFHEVELGPDGRFTYIDLPLYWCEPHRRPFLITADGQLAGFILLKRGSAISAGKNLWDVVEFFIVRGMRRRGIGTEIAHKVWGKFPGSWEVRVLEKNSAARRFWEQAITKFKGEKVHPRSFEKDGNTWHLFAFDSKVAAQQPTPDADPLR